MEQFDRIVLVGSSKVLYDAATIVKDAYPKEEIQIIDINPDGPLDTYKKGVPHVFMEKTELMDFLAALTEKTLVFSISNRYIFPRRVVDNRSLVMVNLHHGLLPVRAGRNPNMWAIWFEDEYAGITWHFINVGVDTGDIIVQKKYRIEKDDRPLSMLQKENALALEALRDFLPLENAENLHVMPQEDLSKRELKFSLQMPNDGWLDLDWPLDVIEKFLRATDYGGILPPRRVKWNGTAYEFRIFSIATGAEFAGARTIVYDAAKSLLQIIEDGRRVSLKKLTRVSEV